MSPIFVDPNIAPPEPPLSITSPDGILTATAYADGIGVHLRAVFPIDKLAKVRFIRDNTIPVRSGNDAWAVGGIANAFDMEAPLGTPVTWFAQPVDQDGLPVGDPSQVLSLVLPIPVEPYNSWLKSLNAPNLSQLIFVTKEELPSFDYTARQQLSQIQGAEYQAGTWDKHLAPSTSLPLYTDPEIDQQMMLDLLRSGPLLFQTDPEFKEPDYYFLPGDLNRATTGAGYASGSRLWSVPVIQVARPTPYGAPFYLPGRSYADTHKAAGTYRIRSTLFPSYGDTIQPTAEEML